jgi:hypothetical protein
MPIPAQEEMLAATVHDALAGTLAENPQRVSSLREVVNQDNLEDPHLLSGLEDDLAVLEIVSSTLTQKEKGHALRKLAGKMNDPVAKERLLNLASRVPAVEMEDLVRKRKINKVTGVFNRAWKTTSEVVTGQPRALAVAGTDAFFALTGKNDPETVDKKIAYLAQLCEKEGNASPEELAKGRELITQLEEKKQQTLLRNWKASIKDSARNGETGRVERLCRIGGNLWPEDKEWFDQQLPSPPPHEDGSEGQGSAVEIVRSPSPVNEDPRMMLLRRKLVDGDNQAATIAVDPAREPIDEALAGRRSRTLNYLLFGESGYGLNTHGVARSVAEHGSDAPAAVGILQGAQTLLRGISLMFGNELGVEQAIDAYAEVDRKTPEALSREDLLAWADLCAKAGRYKEALEVLKKHQLVDEKRTHRYRSKWGTAIVKRCEELPAGEDRFHALKLVTTELADTSAAKRAHKLLLETPSTERPVIQVKREDLREYEPYLLKSGINLAREWWDGNPGNGEIGEEGIYWDPQGVVWYRVGKNSTWRSIPQDPKRIPALAGLFTQIEDRELARQLADKRHLDRKFPVEIEGGLGPDSSYVTPKIVQYEVDQDEEGLFQ